MVLGSLLTCWKYSDMNVMSSQLLCFGCVQSICYANHICGVNPWCEGVWIFAKSAKGNKKKGHYYFSNWRWLRIQTSTCKLCVKNWQKVIEYQKLHFCMLPRHLQTKSGEKKKYRCTLRLLETTVSGLAGLFSSRACQSALPAIPGLVHCIKTVLYL